MRKYLQHPWIFLIGCVLCTLFSMSLNSTEALERSIESFAPVTVTSVTMMHRWCAHLQKRGIRHCSERRTHCSVFWSPVKHVNWNKIFHSWASHKVVITIEWQKREALLGERSDIRLLATATCCRVYSLDKMKEGNSRICTRDDDENAERKIMEQ